jgi:hypothetical protein
MNLRPQSAKQGDSFNTAGSFYPTTGGASGQNWQPDQLTPNPPYKMQQPIK